MSRVVFSWVVLILLAVFAGAGCRRNVPQKTDEEGHLIVEDASKSEQTGIVLQQQMIQEMKGFDQAVEQWAAQEAIQPENQPIDLARVVTRLNGRLAGAMKDGKLVDPAGNPYVILALDPGSSIRITVSASTAARPEFKDLNWGEYAPRQN
jgi:hypothetical protein